MMEMPMSSAVSGNQVHCIGPGFKGQFPKETTLQVKDNRLRAIARSVNLHIPKNPRRWEKGKISLSEWREE